MIRTTRCAETSRMCSLLCHWLRSRVREVITSIWCMSLPPTIMTQSERSNYVYLVYVIASCHHDKYSWMATWSPPPINHSAISITRYCAGCSVKPQYILLRQNWFQCYAYSASNIFMMVEQNVSLYHVYKKVFYRGQCWARPRILSTPTPIAIFVLYLS